MMPVRFDECNTIMKAPKELEGSCNDVPAYVRDEGMGAKVFITGWIPTPEELKDLNDGNPLYLICAGGMPPVILSTVLL